MPPFVTFLSDFGAGDQFAGICHGVINRVCPEAVVIHLGHGIEPQSVGQGARILAGAMPYLPVGVHMAVVDPGVGSERRGVVLRSADGRLFVGPDNGLLVPAAEACGGIELAVELTNREYMLDQVSHTFHGRDVFSPVAGHLADGLDPRELGPEVDPPTLVRPQLLGFERDGTALGAIVQHVDRFGNIQLSVGRDAVADVFQAGLYARHSFGPTAPSGRRCHGPRSLDLPPSSRWRRLRRNGIALCPHGRDRWAAAAHHAEP